LAWRDALPGGLVALPCSTGRDFAGGRSGGGAYVLDVTGDFPSRCNMAMVGLEKLQDPQEAAEVRAMIERHVRYTGSDRGRFILQLWEDMVPKFVKVMPKDYNRVLMA